MTLFVAIRLGPKSTAETVSEALTKAGKGFPGHFMFNDAIMADTTNDAIKRRVAERIKQHPTEQWLILSGNLIAGVVDQPPIGFKEWEPEW